VTIPKEVRIGPYLLEVRIVDEPFPADDKRSVLSGEIDHNACLIRLTSSSPDRMFATLWHEVLHGIDEMAGTDLSEDTIARLAPILAMVLIDNGYTT
jgi:hypothetical protein